MPKPNKSAALLIRLDPQDLAELDALIDRHNANPANIEANRANITRLALRTFLDRERERVRTDAE